jgi:hypothetical protein
MDDAMKLKINIFTQRAHRQGSRMPFPGALSRANYWPLLTSRVNPLHKNGMVAKSKWANEPVASHHRAIDGTPPAQNAKTSLVQACLPIPIPLTDQRSGEPISVAFHTHLAAYRLLMVTPPACKPLP